jgi:hypothetical protein
MQASLPLCPNFHRRFCSPESHIHGGLLPRHIQDFYNRQSEVQQLVDDHILAPHSILQWWPAKGEDILTPNTKEIVVMKPFF